MQPYARVHVIIPFYNAKRWIERCLSSVNYQAGYRPKVHVVDDASTDGSSKIAESLCEELRFNYRRNHTNQKCPLNIFQAIQHSEANPWDVIFLLDGDDYLPHGKVLERVDQLFAEANTWLTYGQYMSDPPDFTCAPAIPPETCQFRNEAAAHQYFNHPLIFRRGLFDAIPITELQDSNGSWFTSGYDRTIMIPMLELASPPEALPHWKFINEVMYVYNSVNATSEVLVPTLQESAETVNEIYDRSILEPLLLSPQQKISWFGSTTAY